MQNRTILYVTGMVALTAIVITCIIVFAQQEEEKNIDQLVNELKTSLHQEYGEKPNISIYFKDLSKHEAEQISKDLSNALNLPEPTTRKLVEDEWYYGSISEDTAITVSTYYTKEK